MQKGPLPKDVHAIHSARVRAGQARARAVGKHLGRPRAYHDDVVREAMRRHENGETWAAIADAIGIPLDRLYDRVAQLRSAAQHAD